MRESFGLDETQIARYLSGEMPEAERAVWDTWITRDPKRTTFMAALRAATKVDEPAPLDVETFQQRVESRISSLSHDRGTAIRSVAARQPQHSLNQNAARREARFSWRWMAQPLPAFGTALILGVFTLVVGWQQGAHRARAGLSKYMSSYTTQPGQRSTVTLPDGSVVYLNVDSRLQVPMDYATGNRHVKLTGSAVFTVVPKSDLPFTVNAGSSIARVLGTQFLVRRYPSDASATVSVREGKVSVGNVILTAHQQATVASSGDVQRVPFNTRQFSVLDQVLTLTNISLRDAVPELNRWYDVEIRFGDSALANRIITGEFTAGSVTDLATMLEWTFHVEVVRSGRILTLYASKN